MPGWEYVGTRNGFDIWENQYFIPVGFCYDSYITREEYDQVPEDDRNLLLLKTMVLDDEQALRYGDILNHFEGLNSVSYTESGYFADCLARRSMSCSSFERDNSGFTRHRIQADKDRRFFSESRNVSRMERHRQRRTGADRAGERRLYGGARGLRERTPSGLTMRRRASNWGLRDGGGHSCCWAYTGWSRAGTTTHTRPSAARSG